MKMDYVTVIIPTLGRASLQSVLQAIVLENIVTEVLVLLDSKIKKSDIRSWEIANNPKIKIVEGGDGISSNINLAFQFLNTEYFCLFSDDDIWIEGSLEKQLQDLQLSNLDYVLGGVSYIANNRIPVTRPSIRVTSLSEALLVPWYKKSPYYISLVTFLGKKTITSIKFNEKLTTYEDVEWLLRLEHAGKVFRQTDTQRAQVYYDSARAVDREGLNQIYEIVRALHQISELHANNYLLQILPKNFLRTGRMKDLIFLISVQVKLSSSNSMKLKVYLQAPFYFAYFLFNKMS